MNCAFCQKREGTEGTLFPEWNLCKPCILPVLLPRENSWTCPDCKGKCTVECSACEGDGVIECDYGCEHECRDCDGDGSYPCDTCAQPARAA